MVRVGLQIALCFLLLVLSGCETPIIYQSAQDRATITASIAKETPGDYFIGRRFYNEQKKLAPDRDQRKIGSDNNYEYRLNGYFSGEKVYEPASDSFYPEFVLNSATVISTNAPLIFPDQRWIDPAIRLIGPPQY